jgi:uncharacterized protein
MVRKPTLLIFAKSPRMGVSKTRLAAGIGVARAWRVKRAMDGLTCRVASHGQAWRTMLAVAPARDEGVRFPNAWPDSLARLGQGKGDLGARMARALRRFSRGAVCIIGSDLPDLRTADLTAAFKMLRDHDVVLGPASDGGYWLIGMRAQCARVAQLDAIRWSSAHTLADTVARLPKKWRVGYLRELEDVDDATSFHRTRRRRTNTSPPFQS